MPAQQLSEDASAVVLERQTARKISLRLIPLLAVSYCIAYIDRVNVSFAALQMNRDLHFNASVYGFGAGVFFLSYAACEVPSNLLLLRFGPRRWIARVMVTWGLIAVAMVLVSRPWEFYVLRFLLGVAEAGFAPAVLYYFTLWFPQTERARAISRFYLAIPISGMFMASISGPLLGLDGRLHFAGWRWLFLLEALPAIALGILVFMILPDGPGDARWLSSEERTWVQNRIRQESNVASDRHTAIGETLRDSRIWTLGFFNLATMTTGYAYSLSAPLLIKDLTGYSNSVVGLIIASISFCVAVAIIANGAVASGKRSPYLHIVIPTFVIIFGCLGVGLFRAPALVICSLALIPIAHLANFSPLCAIATSFLEEKAAATGLALMSSIGLVGGFIGPYYMGLVKDHTGSYQKGFPFLAVPCFAAVLMILRLRRRTVSIRSLAPSTT
jgi:MFS transporter, ACS family, tartrate transporter